MGTGVRVRARVKKLRIGRRVKGWGQPHPNPNPNTLTLNTLTLTRIFKASFHIVKAEMGKRKWQNCRIQHYHLYNEQVVLL